MLDRRNDSATRQARVLALISGVFGIEAGFSALATERLVYGTLVPTALLCWIFGDSGPGLRMEDTMDDVITLLLKVSLVIFMAGNLLDMGLRLRLQEALEGLQDLRFAA